MAASSAGSSTDMSDRLYGAWVSVVNIGYGPSSPRTARTRSPGTSYWSWNAPILGASTKGTRPSRAFLSRVIAARTRSASIAGARTGRPRAARSRSWRRTVRDDTQGDRFAVGEARVSRRRLEGVADRVAVVEGVPQLALALVALHDPGLQPAGAADDALDDGEVAGAERRRVPFDLGEVVGVEHDAVLDDLGEPRLEFARRQRERGRGITDDQ